MYKYFILFILFLFLCLNNSCQNKANTLEHPGKFNTIQGNYGDSNVDGYNTYIPKAYSENGNPFPVIIFLQGGLGVGGEVSTIFNWELPRDMFFTKDFDSELNKIRLNQFIFIYPHISKGQFYDNIKGIEAVLDEVAENYNIDPDRVYLTGLSRGGHGTWGIASRIPDRFAAIAPLAGGDHGIDSYKNLARLPMWVTHNIKDEEVDFENSVNTTNRIAEINGIEFHQTATVDEADYMNYDYIFTSGSNPEHEHNSWKELYDNPNFYKWLLKYSKK